MHGKARNTVLAAIEPVRPDLVQMSLMSEAAQPETNFDFSAAAVGTGVGVVAGYLAMKMLRSRKNDDTFSR